MAVTQYQQIDAFLDDTEAFLKKDEKENNLILRIATAIKQGHYSNYIALAVKKDQQDTQDQIMMAAIMTPPHRLLLSSGSKNAVQQLTSYIKQHNIDIPGVTGNEHSTNDFARLWDGTLHQGTMLIFQTIDQVIMPSLPAGDFQQAGEDDVFWLTKWVSRFAQEAGLSAHEQKENPDKILRKIQNGEFFFWAVNEKPVSIAGFSPITGRGVCIGSVYTPPEQRGHGYASACVARISQDLLDKNLWCALFTDAANPTSNKIYKAIGYKEYCRYQEYNVPLI